jgi:hypothetical protein
VISAGNAAAPIRTAICYNVVVTRDQVKAVLDRVPIWLPEAQEEAVASLVTIEEEFMGSHELSPDDREALSRSADDVRQGRFATDDQVKATFDRYRRS